MKKLDKNESHLLLSNALKSVQTFELRRPSSAKKMNFALPIGKDLNVLLDAEELRELLRHATVRLESPERFPCPIPLADIGVKRAPQSFCYVTRRKREQKNEA